MWCKQGQYLDYKNCVCKNRLIGKVNSMCTSFINETMSGINDDLVAVDNNNTSIYIGLFSLAVFVDVLGFVFFLILSGLNVKIYLKKDLRIKILMM